MEHSLEKDHGQTYRGLREVRAGHENIDRSRDSMQRRGSMNQSERVKQQSCDDLDVEQQLSTYQQLYDQRLTTATALQSKLHRAVLQLRQLKEADEGYDQSLDQVSALHFAFEEEEAHCLVSLEKVNCLETMMKNITGTKQYA